MLNTFASTLSFADVEELKAKLRASDLERNRLMVENASLRSNKKEEDSPLHQRTSTNVPSPLGKLEQLKESSRARSYSRSANGKADSGILVEASSRADELEAEKAYFQVMAEGLERRLRESEQQRRDLEQRLFSTYGDVQEGAAARQLIADLRKEVEECREVIRRQAEELLEKSKKSPPLAYDRVDGLESQVHVLQAAVRELSRQAVSQSRERSMQEVGSTSTHSAQPGAVDALQRIIAHQGQYIKVLQEEVTAYCCSPETSLPALDKSRSCISYSRAPVSSESPLSASEGPAAEHSSKTKKEAATTSPTVVSSSVVSTRHSKEEAEQEPEPLPPRGTVGSATDVENESKVFDISFSNMDRADAAWVVAQQKQVHFDDVVREDELLSTRLTQDTIPDSCPATPPPRRTVLLKPRFSDLESITSSRPSETVDRVSADHGKENRLP